MNEYSETSMNQDRAEWANAAIHAFAAQTGQDAVENLDDPGCFDEVVGDLICDLGHLARRCGHDYRLVAANGLGRFQEECDLAEEE
jgi:hypothetical protein